MTELYDDSEKSHSTWQSAFVQILPEIEQRLQRGFRHLDPESREDAVEEGVIHALFAFIRLHEQGRAGSVSASNHAWYAARQVRRGRPAVGRMSMREPLSRYAQLKSRTIHREPWIDVLVEDRRASIADQVAIRIDAREWLATLSRRTKQIAKDLAVGFSTSEVARKHGVTAGRISQLRRKLQQSWLEFQGEQAPYAVE